MSQLKGVFSWRALLTVAGLFLFSLLAPLTWQRGQPSAAKHLGPSARSQSVAPATTIIQRIEPEIVLISGEELPQRAPLGPLVADNIDLDPSITQPPVVRGHRPAGEEPRLSNLPSSPIILDPNEPLESLAEPIEPLPPATIQPAPAPPAAPPITKAWPHATGLLTQLDAVAATVPAAAGWAEQTKAILGTLAGLDTLGEPAAAEALAQLDRQADAGKRLALGLADEQQRSSVLRAGYAVVRRVVIWTQVHKLAASGDVELAPIIDRHAWEAALAEVNARLNATGAAGNWRRYLRIDEARERFDSSSCSPADQRELARDILHRMHSTQLSHDQEVFLRTPPFTALSAQLHERAAEKPDLVAALAAIERHEANDCEQCSRGLAKVYDVLRWSSDLEIGALAETINTYYRNANVRVALSSELVNRMLPRAQQQYEPVQDTILEARVEGDSVTTTRLRLVLVPDRSRWNIGLEALGEVASRTSSSKGPATFHQDGWSLFRARKRVTVDRRGIRMQNAEAAANASNNLNDFQTDFDGIPLFGNLIRAIARNQYESSQPAAKQEVEGKIVWRATSQLDREVAQKLEKSKRDLQTKLVNPLRELDLEPTAVDLETTPQRLIARCRVAGRDQVSASTPRPQAPGDSILSVQLHETALNNVLEHLRLHGQRIELRELYRDMTTRFSQEPVTIPEDLPENVYVTFADEDPVRVDCQDGRVRLQIRLKELMQEGTDNRWTNFTVRGYYAPDADQLDANLVREGAIELLGDGLKRFGDRVALAAIFGKVLNRNRKLNLVNKQIAQAPELRDQQVTQFVIHDGWIGVALGPKSPGRAAAMQPRPDLKTRTE
jgi:hypothetical protein